MGAVAQFDARALGYVKKIARHYSDERVYLCPRVILLRAILYSAVVALWFCDMVFRGRYSQLTGHEIARWVVLSCRRRRDNP